jgi:phosphoglycerate dehydrogenase-like enzyme/glyoxylase-like metal-dependent hydrolase (beta-lactamase superfamily II)
MARTVRICSLVAAVLLAAAAAPAAESLPKMNFNDVKEIAPGVFFRYSAISPTNPKIFGGSNNIWVIFEDYVVVIDANFPREAGDVIKAIRKTTKKPIRYVFDTHHHGDHSYGNAVFAQEGASVIAQTNCARLLRVDGPKDFRNAGRGPNGRKDVRESKLKMPDISFDKKLVLDDGKQRVEFLFFGHAHTSGDGCAYLPRHKLLCTGDACVNGAYNFMGHSDSASWVRALEQMQQLDINMVCPGHGPLAGKDLLAKQKRYFVELRKQVRKGISAGKEFKDILKGIDMPWYKDWTGVPPTEPNVQHVYDELTGRIKPWEFEEDFGLLEGPSPTKHTKGWTRPRRIVVPQGLMAGRIEELKRVAPNVLFVPAQSAEEAAKLAADADAVLGFCTADIVKAGKGLRWIQAGSAGVDKHLSASLAGGKVVLTDTRRIYGPSVADHAFVLLLSLTRGTVGGAHAAEPKASARGTNGPLRWNAVKWGNQKELRGKTMLVVGLGGIGTQVSRRAHAFGMRVMALDARKMDRPDFVFSLDRPEKLMDLLPKADVVVLACPLTAETRGLLGQKQLRAMKKSAYVINVAHGGLVKTADLVAALKKGTLAGAGLDVTDPEPLPDDHALWKLPNVVITPHTADRSPEARERQWRLWRENVRRFGAGERLLCVVDKGKG